MMFKIVILQKYYNLSDEQTEFQIKGRLSFLDFLGLQIGDDVPDEKTIWLFKEKLKEKKLSNKLFKLFSDLLINNGIIARKGSILNVQQKLTNKMKSKIIEQEQNIYLAT